MPELIAGIDCSAYQDPKRIDWKAARRAGVEFCYARGVRMGREIDSRCAEHVKRARDAEMAVGLYAFFSPTVAPVTQADLLLRAQYECGIRPGDLLPAIDVESATGAATSPAWVPRILDLLEYVEDCLVYVNPHDMARMGNPDFRRPLWVAQYRAQPPDVPWSIWQNRVAPAPWYSGTDIDHDVARELLTIGNAPDLPGPAPVVDLDDRQIAALAALAALEGIR